MQAKTRGAHRIVVYGVGQFGQHIVRFAVEKGWPIVAAYNRAGDKIGKDVGRLAGLGYDLGVPVQDCETADYAGVQADIGVVTTTNRLAQNMPAYRRLMKAGLNVLCHGAESYYPRAVDKVLAAEIDALARANRVTFTGGGIWDMSRIWMGIAAAGPCTELRALRHSSISDAQSMGREQMLICGVGMSVDEYEERMVKAAGEIGGYYKTIPWQVMAALGYDVTQVSERREPVLFDTPIYCELLERELEPGVCAGTRLIIELETAQGVSVSARIEPRLLRPGEVEHTLWEIDGKPVSRIRVERDDQAHYSASSLFNRIPDVIGAPPGIMPVSKLGMLRHTASRGVPV